MRLYGTRIIEDVRLTRPASADVHLCNHEADKGTRIRLAGPP